MNLVILFALMVQGAVAKSSHVAGALVGYLITTGILIWGLSVYGSGGYIEFFSITLSQPVFIGACLIWYLFDTKELLANPAAVGGTAG